MNASASIEAAPHAALARQPRVRHWGRPDGWRLALYSLLLCFTLVLDNGPTLFLLSALLIGVSVLRHLRHNRPFFSMTAVWELAFLLIVCAEGLAEWDRIVRHVGPSAALEAARYLTSANALVMVGHALTFRRWRTRKDVSVVLNVRRRRGVVWFMVVMMGIYLVRSTGPTLEVFLYGRVGSTYTSFGSTALDAVLQGLNAAIGLVLPCMIGYYVLWVRQGRLRTAVLYSLPILVLHFMGGTRFTLLFGLGGLIIMQFVREPIPRRKLVRMVLAATALVLLSTVMSGFRTFGVLGDAPASFDRAPTERVIRSEGVVRGMGEIVRYFSVHNHLGGASVGGVFVFWVPRAVWPDKPTLLGYWFPRAYGHRGIASGHSTAYTFAGDPYVDFGFAGGLFVVFLMGLGLGRLDRYALKVMGQRGHPSLVMVAPLYAGVFFAVRSFDTTLILMSGIVLLGLTFRRLLGGSRAFVIQDSAALVTTPGRS